MKCQVFKEDGWIKKGHTHMFINIVILIKANKGSKDHISSTTLTWKREINNCNYYLKSSKRQNI